ncbi:unnamed protein product [Malus baccata var. baccata]|uniref:Uncharacterized protein n=1 Tax=Malus domestica TaxID=3750 RepID=A0A498JR53_MALDO|nr:hypothetical protein DVH24_009970 [Malus domestica]
MLQPQKPKIQIWTSLTKGSNDNIVQIFGLDNQGVDLPNTNKSIKFGNNNHLITKYFKDAKIFKKKHITEAYENSLQD